MRYIPLTRNLYTIVDNIDYPELSKHSWYAHKSYKSFYAARMSRQKDGKQIMIYMHRQILGLKPRDKREADHIYHNTLDNRRNSIKICTRQENLKNKRNKK